MVHTENLAHEELGIWRAWQVQASVWAMLDECLLSNGHRSWVYGRRGSAGSTGLVWDLLVRWDLAGSAGFVESYWLCRIFPDRFSRLHKICRFSRRSTGDPTGEGQAFPVSILNKFGCTPSVWWRADKAAIRTSKLILSYQLIERERDVEVPELEFHYQACRASNYTYLPSQLSQIGHHIRCLDCK